MEWIKAIADAVTQLSVVKKERLAALVILGLFIFGFVIQHNIIQTQKEDSEKQKNALLEHEKHCSDLIAKIREDERLRSNNQITLFQNQINDFVIEKNKQNDSVHTYFFNIIKKYNLRINKINNEIDNIKDYETN